MVARNGVLIATTVIPARMNEILSSDDLSSLECFLHLRQWSSDESSEWSSEGCDTTLKDQVHSDEDWLMKWRQKLNDTSSEHSSHIFYVCARTHQMVSLLSEQCFTIVGHSLIHVEVSFC